MDRQSSLFDAVLTKEKDQQTKQRKMKTEKKRSYSTGRNSKVDLQAETRKVKSKFMFYFYQKVQEMHESTSKATRPAPNLPSDLSIHDIANDSVTKAPKRAQNNGKRFVYHSSLRAWKYIFNLV